MIYHYLNNNPVCLPTKRFGEFLKTGNYLSEYYTLEDKTEVLNNLGIPDLIENLIKEHIVSTFGNNEDLIINQKTLSEIIDKLLIGNEKFTKEEILSLISSLKKLDIVPVGSIDELPKASEETRRKLWFVLKTSGNNTIEEKKEETTTVETTVSEGPSSSSTNENAETPPSDSTEIPVDTTNTETEQENTRQDMSQEETQLEESQEESLETLGETQNENISEDNNEGENTENTENNTNEGESTGGTTPAEETPTLENNTQTTTTTTTKITTKTTVTEVTEENTHDVYVTVVKTIYPEVNDNWKNVINLGDIHESRYEKIIKDLGVGTYIFNVLGTLIGTAYIYKVTPLSMTYDKPTIPEKVDVGQMAMNRDDKYYQVTEDGRWREYIPASTYSWQCIGTTHINFNAYYTKEEIDNLFAKETEVEIVTGITQSEYHIDPNRFYKFADPLTYLWIILNTPTDESIVNEYMFEFVAADGFEFHCDGIRWGDGEAPEWEVGNTYQVSILNGLAVAYGWEPVQTQG